jgi:type IV pilus assembly protein PilE
LIEVMIALVVIALLAAVAYPAYTSAIAKNRRAEGVAAIAAVQLAQERWRSNNDTYSDSFTDLKVGEYSSPAEYYKLTISNNNEIGYTVTATAVTGKAQASDTNCVRLQVVLERAIVKYRSGASDGALDTTNQHKCWSR